MNSSLSAENISVAMGGKERRLSSSKYLASQIVLCALSTAVRTLIVIDGFPGVWSYADAFSIKESCSIQRIERHTR